MCEKEYGTISIQEILYLVSFLILFGARAVGLYEGKLLYNMALVLGLLTWGIKILMTEHSVLEYIIIGSLILLALIIYKNTGEKGILLYFTMMLGMKNVSVKRVFKCGLGILSISYIILVTTSLLGINNEIMYIQNRSGWGNVFRHSLGYPHPNTLHNTYVILIVLILYLEGRQNWKKLLVISTILFLISYYIYLYSGSRTGLLTTGIYLLINFWFQMRKNISFVENLLVYLLYPACLIFSILGPFVIKGKLYELINKLLSNRWMLSIYYLQNEPITLLGTRFKETPNIHYMIDSSFLYSFLQLGIIAFCIITFLFMSVIHECIKREDRSELAVIVSFCIMGISDPFMFNLSYKNLIFLFIGKMVYDYLQKADSKLPELMKYPIQMWKVGNRKFTYSKIVIKNIEWDKKELLYVACLFVVTVMGSVTLYMAFTEVPNAMYVNQVIWEDNARRNLAQLSAEQGKEVYLTDADVKQLKLNGDLIVHYLGKEEPMYMLTGDAPRMEYVRNAVSVGFWSGVLAVGVLLCIKYVRREEFN